MAASEAMAASDVMAASEVTFDTRIELGDLNYLWEHVFLICTCIAISDICTHTHEMAPIDQSVCSAHAGKNPSSKLNSSESNLSSMRLDIYPCIHSTGVSN